MDEKTITLIKDMIGLDMAAASAYELCAEKCQDEEIRGKFNEFMGDHLRHVQELSECVRREGIEPPAELDAKGVVIQGYTMLSALEDRTAVLAMRGNEELTNESYMSALQMEMPGEVKEVFLRAFEDERRHLGWIRGAIKARGWDHEPTEVKEIVEHAKAA
jgi:competence protein ComEA